MHLRTSLAVTAALVLGLGVGRWVLAPSRETVIAEYEAQQREEAKQLAEAKQIAWACALYLEEQGRFPAVSQWRDEFSEHLMPHMAPQLAQYQYRAELAGKKLSDFPVRTDTPVLEGPALQDGRKPIVWADGRVSLEKPSTR